MVSSPCSSAFFNEYCSAQLEGRLYLDKDEYQVGEPVYLRFDLTNNGKEPMQGVTGSSYSFCGGYQIEISSDPSADLSSCSPIDMEGVALAERGPLHQARHGMTRCS